MTVRGARLDLSGRFIKQTLHLRVTTPDGTESKMRVAIQSIRVSAGDGNAKDGGVSLELPMIVELSGMVVGKIITTKSRKVSNGRKVGGGSAKGHKGHGK